MIFYALFSRPKPNSWLIANWSLIFVSSDLCLNSFLIWIKIRQLFASYTCEEVDDYQLLLRWSSKNPFLRNDTKSWEFFFFGPRVKLHESVQIQARHFAKSLSITATSLIKLGQCSKWNTRPVTRINYLPRWYYLGRLDRTAFERASSRGSGSMLPRNISENFILKIAGNAPKFYTLVHIFQLYKIIFPPRNSALNVDQL